MYSLTSLVPCALSLATAVLAAPQSQYGSGGSSTPAVKTTNCNGKQYVYEELAGYGYLPPNGRDKVGDTLGGIGSSLAIEPKSWRKQGKSYKGIFWALPDRGWNTNGTLNYQNRVQKLEVTFTPRPGAAVQDPAEPNLQMKLLETVLFTDPSGEPTTGLDPNIRPPYKRFPGYPFGFPSVNYEGNGFGQDGPGGFRVSFDSEGIFLAHDGTFWTSDEYGDYMYHFDKSGKMIDAIRPPNAFIPRRNDTVSFSANSPPIYDPDLEPVPEDNPTGRNNNQGLEGVTTNPEGTKLYALTQSALQQDGALDGVARNSRLIIYDITTSPPTYEAEYVVPLPLVDPSDEDSDVAAQSEIHYISDTQFLVLARDGDVGAGQDETRSLYRHVDVFDISEATDIKGRDADCFTCAIANEDGDLNDDITPAQYCSWLDFNINSQLRRFGVHNGGAQDAGLLNEKWESLGLVPVNPGKNDGEYFLFSISDNDFITQDGAMNFGRLQYADESGFDLLNQALVFKVKIPKGRKPLVG